jgi:hypothetical protein
VSIFLHEQLIAQGLAVNTQNRSIGAPRSAAVSRSPALAVLQTESTAEVRAALLAATVSGLPTQRIALKDLQADSSTRAALAAYTGEILPVGSVEFVRAALSALGLPEPEGMGYAPVADFLRREIRPGVLYELQAMEEPVFVKPVATKAFSGFVFDPRPGAEASEYQAEQLAAIAKLKPSTRVWFSEVVEFVCEWRYYVDAGGRILARARYDADGADDAPEPTAEVVQSAINSTVAALEARGNAHPFAVDVGVLASGRTAVVELTDAWAIGLYGHARTPAGTSWKPGDYLEFLRQRWRSIVAHAQLHAAKQVAKRLAEGAPARELAAAA